MVEWDRFELSISVRGCWYSRPVPSTTRLPLQSDSTYTKPIFERPGLRRTVNVTTVEP